jgi:hypothetical protein
MAGAASKLRVNRTSIGEECRPKTHERCTVRIPYKCTDKPHGRRQASSTVKVPNSTKVKALCLQRIVRVSTTVPRSSCNVCGLGQCSQDTELWSIVQTHKNVARHHCDTVALTVARLHRIENTRLQSAIEQALEHKAIPMYILCAAPDRAVCAAPMGSWENRDTLASPAGSTGWEQWKGSEKGGSIPPVEG